MHTRSDREQRESTHKMLFQDIADLVDDALRFRHTEEESALYNKIVMAFLLCS